MLGDVKVIGVLIRASVLVLRLLQHLETWQHTEAIRNIKDENRPRINESGELIQFLKKGQSGVEGGK